MEKLLAIKFQKSPFEIARVEAQLEEIKLIRDREIEDLIASFIGHVHQINLIDIITMLTPLDSVRHGFGAAERGQHVYGVVVFLVSHVLWTMNNGRWTTPIPSGREKNCMLSIVCCMFLSPRELSDDRSDDSLDRDIADVNWIHA